jgi:hypothetical protein
MLLIKGSHNSNKSKRCSRCCIYPKPSGWACISVPLSARQRLWANIVFRLVAIQEAVLLSIISRVGQNRIYIYIHRIFGDFQAKYTICTPYTVYIWFWPTLIISIFPIQPFPPRPMWSHTWHTAYPGRKGWPAHALSLFPTKTGNKGLIRARKRLCKSKLQKDLCKRRPTLIFRSAVCTSGKSWNRKRKKVQVSVPILRA